MRILSPLLFSVITLFLIGSAVHSGGDKDLRTLIAKALKARGSEESAAKHKAMTLKGTGTFYGLGQPIPFSGEWNFQGQTQARWTLEIKVMDQMLTVSHIINGDKGWQKLNDEVTPLPEAELAEEKEEMYAKWVTSLVPLKEKEFKLAPLGEIKIEDKPAIGVRVSRDGKRDVNLYFDKGSSMLLKSEYPVKDVKGGGDKEMTQEAYFSDYKEFKGTKIATKFVIKRDGQQFVEGEMTDVQPVDSLPETLFAKP